REDPVEDLRVLGGLTGLQLLCRGEEHLRRILRREDSSLRRAVLRARAGEEGQGEQEGACNSEVQFSSFAREPAEDSRWLEANCRPPSHARAGRGARLGAVEGNTPAGEGATPSDPASRE